MLSKRLRHLREQKKKTQQEVADALKMQRGKYSNYEQGSRHPDYETLTLLANYFDVSTDYLIGRTENPKGMFAAPIGIHSKEDLEYLAKKYDKRDRVSDAVADDQDLREFWEALKNRESLQLMFKQVKNMSDDDIKKIVRIIKAIEDEEAGK